MGSDCSSTTSTTLGQAYTNGEILPSATLGQIQAYNTTATTLGQIEPSDHTGTTLGQIEQYDTSGTTVGQLLKSGATFPGVTLGDLMLSVVPPSTYNWPSVNLSNLPLNKTDEVVGGTVTYTATVTVSGAPGDVTVGASLPATFGYIPGSAALGGYPRSDPPSGSLTWDLGTLIPGTYSFQFSALAGFGLGPATASVTANISGSTAAPASSSASTDVVDGAQPQVNNPNTPVALSVGHQDTASPTTGNLQVGYIASAGSVDDYSVTVPQGAELSVALTNTPANYDLELFGPAPAQIQGTPQQNLPVVSDTVPGLVPGSTSEATPGSQDIPITPPVGDQLIAVANSTEGNSQNIQTPPLNGGTYVIQVSGYNGAYSSQPFLLRANVLGGSVQLSCPAISYPNAMPAPAANQAAVPSGVNTLFLVNTQRLSAAFGSTAEQGIMTDLQQLAADGADGVNGAIVPVDAYPSVQAAYNNWAPNPCSVDNANAVVSAISAVVDQIRSDNPTVQNVVVIGADDQIPFARVADGAAQSNERDYGASTFSGEDNVEGLALSRGYYFSDDPYAAQNPLGVGSATLYLPQLAVGRLVESDTQIDGALRRFMTSHGELNANTSLTTGYSFLTSGANAVAANLAAAGTTASTLINESWTAGDLDRSLGASGGPGVDSINAHFDFSRALPAAGNANPGIPPTLFTTADVQNAAAGYAGRLLFSMGCHSGLEIDTAEVAGATGGSVDDWAKTFATDGALWVANTGYGYADTSSVAYSARLMAGFAGNLTGGRLSIGEALTQAKQQYAGGNVLVSPYDLKALMESTFYGLPMYYLNVRPPAVSSGTTGSAPTPTGTTDPTTGLPTKTFSSAQPVGSAAGNLGQVAGPNGTYYQVNGANPSAPGGTQTTEYRPIEPLAQLDETNGGLSAHGVLLTSLSSTDVTTVNGAEFQPVYSQPATGSHDSAPPAIGNAAFPGTLQRAANYSTFTSNGVGQGVKVDLVTGQFFPDPSHPGKGTQRLFTGIGGQVFYGAPGSALGNDYTPPTIQTSQASVSGTTVGYTVQVTPGDPTAPVREVIILWTGATSPGTWHETVLSGSGSTWQGTDTLPSTDHNVQYFVEAVDAAGNVAVSNNEGTDFNGSAQPVLAISLSGPQTDGYYTDAVTATITALTGSTYSVDNSTPAAVPAGGTLAPIAGVGEHTVTASDGQGHSATQAFNISRTRTVTTVTSSGTPSVAGEPVIFTATVVAATPQAANPAGTVQFLDNGSPAACSGGSNAPLSPGGQASCAVSYTVPGTHDITAKFLGGNGLDPSVTKQPLHQVVGQASANVTVSSSDLGKSVYGLTTQFTAVVAAVAPASGTPTGFVEWLLDGTPVGGTCGGAVGNQLSGGAATCTVTWSSVGAHSVVAQYRGDQSFAGPVGSDPVAEAVKAASAVVVSSNSPSAVVGQPLQYIATITGGGGTSTPSGQVSFTDGATPVTCQGSGEGSLSGTGSVAVAYCTIPGFKAPASDTITANYGGDANNSPASGSFNQVVNKASTSLVIANPAANPAVTGQAVTYAATVSVNSPGQGVPTGTVTFYDGATPITCQGGSPTSPAVQLPSSGTASCSVVYTSTSPSSHQITAVYSGDGNFVGSNNGTSPVTETVKPAPTTTSVAPAAGNANPALQGQTLTFVATVSVQSPGQGTPTGTVVFKDGTTPLTCIGATRPGAPLSPTGTASCSVSFTTGGLHPVGAEYLGDGNFAGSPSGTSSAVVETVNVQTTTTLTTSSALARAGQTVTLTTTVAAVSPATATPGGVVKLTDNGAAIGTCGASTGLTLSGGKASCSYTLATAGAHNLVAQYVPAPYFLASGTGTVTDIATATPCSTLAGCNLHGLNLNGAYLPGANLSGANLNGASLANSTLTGANLSGANLNGVSMPHSDLSNANLSNANLNGADLSYDNLHGANLSGANLNGTNQTGVQR